jgi:hypothetical protein
MDRERVDHLFGLVDCRLVSLLEYGLTYPA